MLAVVERGESPPLLLLVVQTVVGVGEDVFGGICGHRAHWFVAPCSCFA